MFTGAITALVTPFQQGHLDEKALRDLVEWQIQEGIQGIVPCGTTGESVTLHPEEYARVIHICVETARKRIPIIAGAGANATDKTIGLAQAAWEAGADGLMLVAPYYNRPTQEGLYQHFKAVHEAVTLPIILYNIPSRTGVDIADETVARLAHLPRIIGIKESTGQLSRLTSLRKRIHKPFTFLTGEDALVVGFHAQGGNGSISVASNVIPRVWARTNAACAEGKYPEALQLFEQYSALCNVLFCETNPGPVKYAVSLLRHTSPEVRLPLVIPSEANQARIRETMQECGLL